MMRFKLISDIHLEYYDTNYIKNLIELINNDIDDNKNCHLILCGNIGNVHTNEQYSLYKTFLELLVSKFKHIYLVPGNNEYYGSTYDDTNNKLNMLIDELKPNITLMINKCIDINENLSIIGTTLWTRGILELSKQVNDFKNIVDLKKDKYNYLRWHFKDFEFLNKVLIEKANKQLIILTHHCPSYELIYSKNKYYDDMNTFLANNLNELIINNPNIKYWCYGHTHSSNKKYIGNTICISNQWGYPGENTIKDIVEFTV